MPTRSTRAPDLRLASTMDFQVGAHRVETAAAQAVVGTEREDDDVGLVAA